MSRYEFSRGRARLAALAIGVAAGALSLSTAGGAFAAGSGGVTSEGVIYVDHTLYRTVAAPNDLSHTGAPAQSWDLLYNFGGVQKSVAEVAPGDRGFNGGRWQVHAVSAPNGYFARSRYFPSRGSTRSMSPWLMNEGTCTRMRSTASCASTPSV